MSFNYYHNETTNQRKSKEYGENIHVYHESYFVSICQCAWYLNGRNRLSQLERARSDSEFQSVSHEISAHNYIRKD